jgi:hypothetical protein
MILLACAFLGSIVALAVAGLVFADRHDRRILPPVSDSEKLKTLQLARKAALDRYLESVKGGYSHSAGSAWEEVRGIEKEIEKVK